MEKRFFEQLGEQIGRLFPEANGPLGGELNRNITALLSSAFAELDLVSREEFEVQREVLARTRAKLEALESRVSELETASETTPG